jgi:hypothetical protein
MTQKGLLMSWLLSPPLFGHSGGFGETVNRAFMKKALARFQPIFKPKSSDCHPWTCLLARIMTQSISQPQSRVPMVANTSR